MKTQIVTLAALLTLASCKQEQPIAPAAPTPETVMCDTVTLRGAVDIIDAHICCYISGNGVNGVNCFAIYKDGFLKVEGIKDSVLIISIGNTTMTVTDTNKVTITAYL